MSPIQRDASAELSSYALRTPASWRHGWCRTGTRQTRGHFAAATDSERQLAEQLIALASGPVDWERYRDTSAEELAVLVEAKRARQPAPTAAEEPTVLRLLDALKQSVAAARQGSGSSAIKARKPRPRRVTA